MGQGSLSGIYHEFTHIYDDIHLLLGYPKRRISIIPYTEFHTTIVQMMIATGYTSYYSDKTISLNNKIVDGVHNCKLEEYFDRELQYNKTKLSVDTANIGKSFNYLYMLLLYPGAVQMVMLQSEMAGELPEERAAATAPHRRDNVN